MRVEPNPMSGPNSGAEQVRLEQVQEAAVYVRARLDEHFATPFVPQVAIVCGSGIGGLAEHVQHALRIAYSDIPHFPTCTVPGHAGTIR